MSESDDEYGTYGTKRQKRIKITAWVTIIALVLVGGGMRRIPRGWPVLAAVLVALSLWGQYAWTTELLVLDPPSDYPP